MISIRTKHHQRSYQTSIEIISRYTKDKAYVVRRNRQIENLFCSEAEVTIREADQNTMNNKSYFQVAKKNNAKS